MPTVCFDEAFGPGDAAQLARVGRALGLQGELASVHHPGAEDPFQLLLAAQQGWTLVTKDRDFEKLHYLWCVFRHWQPQHPAHHPGIISTPGNLPNAAIVTRVVDFFRQHAGQPLPDQLWVLGNGGRTWTPRPAFA